MGAQDLLVLGVRRDDAGELRAAVADREGERLVALHAEAVDDAERELVHLELTSRRSRRRLVARLLELQSGLDVEVDAERGKLERPAQRAVERVVAPLGLERRGQAAQLDLAEVRGQRVGEPAAVERVDDRLQVVGLRVRHQGAAEPPAEPRAPVGGGEHPLEVQQLHPRRGLGGDRVGRVVEGERELQQVDAGREVGPVRLEGRHELEAARTGPTLEHQLGDLDADARVDAREVLEQRVHRQLGGRVERHGEGDVGGRRGREPGQRDLHVQLGGADRELAGELPEQFRRAAHRAHHVPADPDLVDPQSEDRCAPHRRRALERPEADSDQVERGDVGSGLEAHHDGLEIEAREAVEAGRQRERGADLPSQLLDPGGERVRVGVRGLAGESPGVRRLEQRCRDVERVVVAGGDGGGQLDDRLRGGPARYRVLGGDAQRGRCELRHVVAQRPAEVETGEPGRGTHLERPGHLHRSRAEVRRERREAARRQVDGRGVRQRRALGVRGERRGGEGDAGDERRQRAHVRSVEPLVVGEAGREVAGERPLLAGGRRRRQLEHGRPVVGAGHRDCVRVGLLGGGEQLGVADDGGARGVVGEQLGRRVALGDGQRLRAEQSGEPAGLGEQLSAERDRLAGRLALDRLLQAVDQVVEAVDRAGRHGLATAY